MEPRQVNRESNAFYSFVAASNDQYMKDITWTNNLPENLYDKTPLPDMLENAAKPQGRHDYHL